MKFRQLDLLAFGPFSDTSIAFEDGQFGLHVVCGPNEAGKSSALRALRQVLFGIPHNSSDNFLHANQNLRIGVSLENAEGVLLECIRRKGRNNTLRGPDDVSVVDPARLADMIGRIDETTFSQRFGIDYEELRQGGKSVVQGGGDLGAMLFSAGAGMADLGRVQKELADEADQLFKKRGSNQQINKAIAELKTARREIKDSQLLTSEWVKHDKAFQQATDRVSEIAKKLLARKSEKSRFTRIDEALPLIVRRQRLGEQLSEVADAPLLPDDFTENRSASVTQLGTTIVSRSNAKKAVEKLRANIGKLQIPENLLEHRSAITRLHTELGSFQKADKDRTGLAGRLQRAEQQAQDILSELGREPKLDQAEGLRIQRTQRQKIQSLAGDCKALLSERKAADDSLRDLRVKIDQVETQLNNLAEPSDPSDLRRSVRRVQKHGDLDQQIVETRATLKRLEDDTAVDLKKLRLWNGTLGDLERLPVPALATVDRFEGEFSDARSVVASVEQQIKKTTEDLQRLAQQLEALRLEQDVPTEEMLSRARQQRDAGWKLVLRSWHGGAMDDDAEISEFVTQFAFGDDLGQAFQSSVETADQVSDRLRREADRVAEKAKLTADRQDLAQQLDDQQSELKSAQVELESLQIQWRDQWVSLSIDPLSPREMRSWVNQQTMLVGAAASLRKQNDAAESLEIKIRSHRSELDGSLDNTGQPTSADDEPLAKLLGRCEDTVQDIESLLRKRQNSEGKLDALRPQLTAAEDAAEQTGSNVDRWRIDWVAAVKQLGLDSDAEPMAANAVIESVDDLFQHIKEANETRDRISGIDRDAEQFKTSVTHLLSQVATDLEELPVDQAVADLNDRLAAASKSQTQLDDWNDRLQEEEGKLENANAQIFQLQETLGTMCREAGCTNPDDLPEAETRSANRKSLENSLRVVDEQLVGLAGGAALNDFVADAILNDADDVKATIDQLNDDIGRLEKEKSEESETIGSERTELRQMNGSGQAADAQEQVEHLLARIRTEAEQFIRLRIASVVLRNSIDRFREQSQGPVLQRASELFGELTLESFSGLRADYDDKGNAVLVGVRSDGKRTVGVGGMSEGTCDQLYLALRLALLESYFAHNEPIPFIVDDILIMFDDDRAVAALNALAKLSQQTQVIFFTHHEHMVQLAKENLDGNLFIHQFHHRHSTVRESEPVES